MTVNSVPGMIKWAAADVLVNRSTERTLVAFDQFVRPQEKNTTLPMYYVYIQVYRQYIVTLYSTWYRTAFSGIPIELYSINSRYTYTNIK